MAARSDRPDRRRGRVTARVTGAGAGLRVRAALGLPGRYASILQVSKIILAMRLARRRLPSCAPRGRSIACPAIHLSGVPKQPQPAPARTTAEPIDMWCRQEQQPLPAPPPVDRPRRWSSPRSGRPCRAPGHRPRPGPRSAPYPRVWPRHRAHRLPHRPRDLGNSHLPRVPPPTCGNGSPRSVKQPLTRDSKDETSSLTISSDVGAGRRCRLRYSRAPL
jgi:hypothetical protein